MAASRSNLPPEAGAPDDIEITPEMMTAGVEEFCSFDGELERPEEVVTQIYLRMEHLRRRQADRSL